MASVRRSRRHGWRTSSCEQEKSHMDSMKKRISDSLAEMHSDIHRRKLQQTELRQEQEKLTGESGASSEQIQAKQKKKQHWRASWSRSEKKRQNWSERWRHLQKNEMRFQRPSKNCRIRNTSLISKIHGMKPSWTPIKTSCGRILRFHTYKPWNSVRRSSLCLRP